MLCQWRTIISLLGTLGLLSSAPLHALQAVDASHSTNLPAMSQVSALFSTKCGVCHGVDGRGGEHAPDIATASEVQQLSDTDLIGIVENGISGAGMPAFGSLGQKKVKAIVDYLRVLQGRGTGTTVKLPGDPQAGESLFFGKARCSTCHMVNGRGGFIASDLSLYGSHETAAKIRGIITDPQKNLPVRSKSTTVITRNGQTLTGMVKNIDNFSIALQTPDGAFHFFNKADLKQIELYSRSLMPIDYGSILDSHELDDLVSYLLNIGIEDAGRAPKEPSRPHHNEDGWN